MPDKNTERFDWALNVMQIKPQHKILEVGCGVGLAVERIASVLTRGSIIALDRSKAMLEKAKKRNEQHVIDKKALFITTDLLKLSLNDQFDKIFCFNVNIFWTQKSTTKELAIIRQHLKNKGEFYIFYGPMFPGWYEKIVDPLKENLSSEQFKLIEIVHDKEIACCCFVTAPEK